MRCSNSQTGQVFVQIFQILTMYQQFICLGKRMAENEYCITMLRS